MGYVYELLLILPLLCRQMFRVFGVGWLLRVETVNVLAGKAFIKLAWKLAVFFAFAIVLEAVIVVYVRSKIDLFASKILETLR